MPLPRPEQLLSACLLDSLPLTECVKIADVFCVSKSAGYSRFLEAHSF